VTALAPKVFFGRSDIQITPKFLDSLGSHVQAAEISISFRLKHEGVAKATIAGSAGLDFAVLWEASTVIVNINARLLKIKTDPQEKLQAKPKPT